MIVELNILFVCWDVCAMNPDTVRACLLSCFSPVHPCVTLWIVVPKAPLCMGFSRQEYWSGLPCPPPGDLPYPGIEPVSYVPCIGRRVLYH